MSGRDGSGGRGSPRRKGARCRLCDEQHWHVYEKRAGSGVWYSRAWDNGRVVKKKIGSHGLALKVAAKWKVEQAEGRFFPKPASVWDPPFADFLDDYMNHTSVVDSAGAERLVRYWKEAPETKGKTMREILRRDARAYRARRRREGAPGAKRKRGAGSDSTLNKELSFARAAYYDFIAQVEERNEEAHLKGRALAPVPANPFASSRSQQRRRTERLYEPEVPIRSRHLSEAEAEWLFAALPDVDARRKVCAAVLSGVDLTPMFSWTWDEHIDFTAKEIRSSRRKGDGKLRPYSVPMVEDLERVLKTIEAEQVGRWGARSKWVWPNASNSDHDDGREFVRAVFKRALIKAGIIKVVETTETRQVRAVFWCGPKQIRGFRTVEKIHRSIEGSFRWKDLRHTFASWLRRKGEGLDVIGELLGHAKNSQMTRRYAHIGADMKDSAVRKLSGLVPSLTDERLESGSGSPDRSLTDPRTDPSLDHPTTNPTVH